MNTMTVRKYFLSLLILLSMGWVGYMLYPSYTEYKKTEKELRDLEISLLNQEKTNESFLKIIHELKTDPRMIERIAREKFGWSKAGEKIYDFSNLSQRKAGNN